MQVSLRAITKRFGDTLANDRVDLDFAQGRVTALLGENGAGKSTLLKILFGVYSADAGSVVIDDREVTIDSPRAAIAHRVGMVFQQFSIIPALTVRENLALTHPRTPWWVGRGARRGIDPVAALKCIAPHIDPERNASQLAVGEIQSVELAKVLNLDARMIILDEPTSVLTPEEAEHLWKQVRSLATDGVSVALVTHKLEDVFACADDVAVMRRGAMVAKVPVNQTDAVSLIRMIVGDDTLIEAKPLPSPHGGRTRVRLSSLSARGPEGAINDVDFHIAAGEVLGIAGVSGNGQQTLADAIAGLLPISAGELIVDGVSLQARGGETPGRAEIAYMPEQPGRNAVALDLSVAVNLYLKRIASLPFVLDPARHLPDAQKLIRDFDIRPPKPDASAASLSGGNLQKLVAARELSGDPVLVVACYPTMGLDLGAAAAVYESLFAHARRGACVLWISEDIDDLLRYAHRIAVMYRGRIVRVADARATSRREIGAWMVGHTTASEPQGA